MEDHKDIILEALNDYRTFWRHKRWRNKPSEIWENKVCEIDKAIKCVEEI